MASRVVTNEISSDDVVNASVSIVGLWSHYERLLKHSSIVLWVAIIMSCLSAAGFAAFIFFVLNDHTDTAAAGLTLLLKLGLPVPLSGGLLWLYDRIQRRAMEVARLLSNECKLISVRLESEASKNPQARDAARRRMAERPDRLRLPHR